jgi:hypothetical protein
VGEHRIRKRELSASESNERDGELAVGGSTDLEIPGVSGLPIVERVDQKARAIRDGVAAWDRIVTEMRGAVAFQLSVAEEQFLESYVALRRQNPIME